VRTNCSNCDNPIDHVEVLLANKELILAMDAEEIHNPTDLQVAIYSGFYCQKCVTLFLQKAGG